jgi:predicted Rossmann fold nucleotide-binding protein DprA/Smf involved in DNA uptake
MEQTMPSLADGRPSMGLPIRNRIVAGMTLGTVVVEANLTSGALITARMVNERPWDAALADLLSVDQSSGAGTQPVTRPQRFPPFSRKNLANLLQIKAKR